jgi:hypothetical protein
MINLTRSWQTHQSSVLPQALTNAMCVVLGNNVFFGGGQSSPLPAGLNGKWWSSQLLPGNQFSQWTQISAMPAPTTSPAFLGVTNDNYLIINGGLIGPSFATNISTQQVVQLNSNGTMGNWSTSSPSFILTQTIYDPVPPFANGSGIVSSNGKLYCWGMTDSAANGSVIQFSANYYGNGNVGPWTPIGQYPCIPAIPTDNNDSIAGGVTVECNGYMVVLAGFGNDPGTAVPNVYTAKINFDGSLKPWQSVGNLNTARYRPGGVVYGNQIIIISGYDGGSTFYNTIEIITVNNDGSISIQQHPSTIQTPVRSTRYQSFIYQDILYILGGTTSGSVIVPYIQYLQLT